MYNKRFDTNIDLLKNRLLNAEMQNLAAHPTVTPGDDTGFFYWNSTDETVYVYTGVGAIWLDLGSDGQTDLNHTLNATQVTITSSTGNDTTINSATTSLAGVMSAADKAKLDGISAGANDYIHPNHTGHVHSSGDGNTTIQPNVVTNAMLADVNSQTIKGRSTAGIGDPQDLTPSQVRAIINVQDGAEPNEATNLTVVEKVDRVTIESSTGANDDIALATQTLAGVMSPGDKLKLDGISGSNTGDQTITLQGDVEGSGTGTFTTTIQPNVVSYDKIQDVAANNVLLGNAAGANSGIQELTPTQVRTIINVENGADVTDSTNVAAAGAVMETDTSTALMQFVIDEDTMVSNSATKVPTQQSVKAYVDNSIVGDRKYKGGYDAATDTPALEANSAGVGVVTGWVYTVTDAGIFHGETLEIGDVIIAEVDAPATAADWTIVQGNLTNAVQGPNSAINNNVVFFDGTSGQLIKDSGLTLSGTNTGDEPNASTTIRGIIEIATQAEADAGTDAERAITPSTLAGVLGNTGSDGSVARVVRKAVGGSDTVVVSHNLGTRFVTAQIITTTSPYDEIECRIERTSTSAITVYFNNAPAAGEYTAIITG